MESEAPSTPRIGIIGSGSWATAIASLLTWHDNPEIPAVNWWVRKRESLEHIERTGHNPHYLRSCLLYTSPSPRDS